MPRRITASGHSVLVKFKPVLLDDFDGPVFEDVLEGHFAKLVFLVGVEEVNKDLLGPLELGLADGVLLLVLVRLVLFFEALISDIGVRLLFVGVHVVAHRDILLFLMAFVEACCGDSNWRFFFFGKLGSWWRRRFLPRGIRSFWKRSRSGWFLLVLLVGPFPDVVVQLLEARLLVGQGLYIDAGESFLSFAKVLDVLTGEVDAGGQLALVFFLGLREEGLEVLLDKAELPVFKLLVQCTLRRVLKLNHMESVFSIKND